MSFQIFADSSANIPTQEAKNLNIEIISYTVTVNGFERKCFEEGLPFEEIAKDFYAEMRAGANVKTSLVGEATITEALEPALQKGDDVIFITIASGISGTYRQALNAQKALQKRFPERKIFVIDSANASLGEGLLAIKAAKLRAMGESVETCAEWLTENTYKMNSYVTVGDLKYLRRGGRVNAALAIAGSLLNIKPILRADGGKEAKLVFSGREHGRKKAISALVKAFDANVLHPESQTIAIAHADCEDEAYALAETLKEHGARDIIIEYYDLCTGSHAGPGTLALFFAGKDRRTPAAQPNAIPAGKRVLTKS